MADSNDECHRTQALFPKGETIYRQGDASRDVYLIQSGLVKLETNEPGGGTLLLGFRQKGDPIGYQTLKHSEPHTHSAVSVEDASICVIQGGHFRSLAESCVSLREVLYGTLLREVREYHERLVSLALRSVKARVADALLNICRLYGYEGDGRGMRIQIDRQEMADFAGTTKEQVSKALSEFKSKGLIVVRAKHFKHVDMAALRSLAGRPSTYLVSEQWNRGEDHVVNDGKAKPVRIPEVA
jgi:CRP-like cAMP-binding protein